MRLLEVFPGKQTNLISDDERTLVIFYEYRAPEVYPRPNGEHADWWKEYLTCRYCGGVCPDHAVAWAFRQYQRQVCSILCAHREFAKQHYCCSKAKPVACVCMYAYVCPEHHPAGIHVGTHD